MAKPLFCQDAHQYCFILRHVYKNDLNVLIELQPSPGLTQALSAKPEQKV